VGHLLQTIEMACMFAKVVKQSKPKIYNLCGHSETTQPLIMIKKMDS
jgi:hypothetical protein